MTMNSLSLSRGFYTQDKKLVGKQRNLRESHVSPDHPLYPGKKTHKSSLHLPNLAFIHLLVSRSHCPTLHCIPENSEQSLSFLISLSLPVENYLQAKAMAMAYGYGYGYAIPNALSLPL